MPQVLRTLFFSALITFFFISDSGAQDFPTIKELEKKAEYALKHGDVYTALDLYEKAASKDPANVAVVYKLGELQLATRDYASAQKSFKKVYEQNSEEYKLAKYYYGLMCKRMGEYEVAETLLKEFSKEYRGTDTYYYKTLAKNEAEGATLAMSLLGQSSTYTVTHPGAGINSAYTDFSPIYLSEKEMVFASLKADSVLSYESSKSPKKLDARARFYLAKKENETWETVGEWKEPFNEMGIETGNGAFSPDSLRFYFTKCEVNKEHKVICQIYKSNKKNGKWTNPEKLPESINAEGYTATHPAVAIYSRTGGDLLFFASDRLPSKGGLDLWSAYYDVKRDRWQAPKNLGRRVNSVGDDMTPFYDPVFGYLYFSSDGWPSVGGLDIFKVQGTDGKFRSYPENLGFPVNSSADDMYYFIDYNSNKGFIVSNREGSISLKSPTCCDDIFEIAVDRSLVFGLDGNTYYKEEGDTSDNKFVMENATVRLFKGESKIPVAETKSDNEGFYFFNLNPKTDYHITVSKVGYLSFKSDIITTKNLLVSDTLHQPSIVLIPKTKKAIRVKNIYYNYDSDELTEASKSVLDTTVYKIMESNPNIVLEIGAHTDSKGSDSYNLKLSEGRAKSVVKYLIQKGIQPERLKAKGYGETIPIAPNENPDGSDNPEGRAQNRRTEFKIVGELESSEDEYSIIENEED